MPDTAIANTNTSFSDGEVDQLTPYEKFMRFLGRSQEFALATPDQDIRTHILENRDLNWSASYRNDVASKGYGANLRRIFPNFIDADHRDFGQSGRFLVLGAITAEAATSHNQAVNAFEHYREGDELVLFEQGFLASARNWAEKTAKRDPSFSCLGYVYDDIAYYYMAEYPNRLIQRLNSEQEPTSAERARARRLIDRMVSQRISKYNSQPIRPQPVNPDYTRRVLVCDQAFRDASTIYGLVDTASFEEMLIAAERENPDAEIIVKTHPDTIWAKGRRTGYYNHLESKGRITVVKEAINPFCLFEEVDKVYVGTSGMGLEALFAGKEVVCFGSPFFAGWGLTDDRQKVPHRQRKRTLEDLFHYFYIWYTIYNVPGAAVPSEIEDALDYIETHRPVRPPIKQIAPDVPPKVSVIIPVYNVETYLETCLTSVLNQSLRDIEIVVVNDCSPDGSREIIDRFAAFDARIVPVHLEKNVGLGFARNIGLDRARGDFVFFLDSDDLLADTTVLRQVVDAAISHSADMVRVRKLEFRDGMDPASSAQLDGKERHFTEFQEFAPKQGDVGIFQTWHCWNFLYRRASLEKSHIRFVTRKWEERSFVCKALNAARKVVALPVPGVLYRLRPESISNGERTAEDFAQYLENIAETGNALAGSPAATIVGLQFAITLVNGSWRSNFRDAIKDAAAREMVARCFDAYGINSESISSADPALLPNDNDLRVLHLLLCALRLRDWEWAGVSINREPVSQKRLLMEYLRDPASHPDFPEEDARELQAAINRYARNSAVIAADIPPSPISVRPRLIIHIGATKTGSTYLQHLMERNRPELLRRGVWYPEMGLYWQPGRAHKQAGHATFASAALRGDTGLRDYLEAGLALMEGRIHTIVLSSEAYFLNQDATRLARYFEGWPVEMMVYLRRQDDWANSQYAEFVAGGAVGRVSLSAGEWLEDGKTRSQLDYLGLLDQWEEAIGRQNIHVRLYDRGRMAGGDLVTDFAETLGLPVLCEMPRPEANQENRATLSAGHIEAMRQFNARPFAGNEAYFAFVQEVTDRVWAWRMARGHPLPKPEVLTNAQRARIMAEAEAGNSEIAERYFEGKRLFADHDVEITRADQPIYGPELEIMAEAYARHGKAPATSRIASYAMSSAAEDAKIVNYGFFGWRLWLLSPFVRRRLVARGSPEHLREFDQDPASFLHNMRLERQRQMARYLYPQGNIYGPFSIFAIWVPLIIWLLKTKNRSDRLARRFRESPIAYFRSHPSKPVRLLGRFVFPLGEMR